MSDENEKFWSGRFERPPSELFERLNASITFDWRLAPYDIQGSLAHARMLAGIGVLTADEFDQIDSGLGKVMADIAGGDFELSLGDEDIHTAIEKKLMAHIGDTAKKLHTARSRNDQVASSLTLFIRDQIEQHLTDVAVLLDALLARAAENKETILPGYTHLQRAQPVLLAHHLLAYFEMFSRDFARLGDALDAARVMPLGAGALAGVNYPINREETAAELGFDRPGSNSMDDVSNRDFALDYLAAASTLSMHLSRLAAELILWSSSEFGFAEIADAFTSGSSIMPQKKNADACEIIRAKAARMAANHLGLTSLLSGLPLTYNKDMQEDKIYVFDSADTLLVTVPVMAEMIATLAFDAGRMRDAAENSFALATDVADYLVGKGMPFRDAHRVVGELVKKCIQEKKGLGDLTMAELGAAAPEFGEDYFVAVDLQAAVGRKDSYGGTAPRQVAARLSEAKERLDVMMQTVAGL